MYSAMTLQHAVNQRGKNHKRNYWALLVHIVEEAKLHLALLLAKQVKAGIASKTQAPPKADQHSARMELTNHTISHARLGNRNEDQTF